MLKTGTLISAAVLSFGLIAGVMAADAPKADAAAAAPAAAATDAPKPKKHHKHHKKTETPAEAPAAK
jgi:hypothetical protein